MSRIAKSLDTLRTQVNKQWPNRSKLSDGWIGDAAHAASKSDHNPNKNGVVQAFDITHDLQKGPDAGALADRLLASKDPRIKYVISNRRIGSSYVSGGAAPWTWRPYSGTNAHTKHCHISVMDGSKLYDDPAEWNIFNTEKPPVILPTITPTAKRLEMGRLIVGYEYSGPLKVFIAPDGNPEIAGVTRKDHPEKYNQLSSLLAQGKETEARNVAAEYIVEYTTSAALWTADLAVEFYLRDCIFNRGPTGAANILQIAVKVLRDGVVGPQTKAALRAVSTDEALASLRRAREQWELEKYARGPGHPQYKGLVNRWNKALADAKTFKTTIAGRAVATGSIVGATIAGGLAASANPDGGFDLWYLLPILVVGLSLAAIVWFVRWEKPA